MAAPWAVRCQETALLVCGARARVAEVRARQAIRSAVAMAPAHRSGTDGPVCFTGGYRGSRLLLGGPRTEWFHQRRIDRRGRRLDRGWLLAESAAEEALREERGER